MATLRNILSRLFLAGAFMTLAILLMGAAFPQVAPFGSWSPSQDLWEQVPVTSDDISPTLKTGPRHRGGMERIESLLMAERLISVSA